MRRKYLFAGLLVTGVLSLLLRNAWPQVAPPEPSAGSTARSLTPSQEEECRSKCLSDCLEQLKGIRADRRHHEEVYKRIMAALDSREEDLARTMRQLIDDQRKKIATAEEELRKIDPEPPKAVGDAADSTPNKKDTLSRPRDRAR